MRRRLAGAYDKARDPPDQPTARTPCRARRTRRPGVIRPRLGHRLCRSHPHDGLAEPFGIPSRRASGSAGVLGGEVAGVAEDERCQCALGDVFEAAHPAARERPFHRVGGRIDVEYAPTVTGAGARVLMQGRVRQCAEAGADSSRNAATRPAPVTHVGYSRWVIGGSKRPPESRKSARTGGDLNPWWGTARRWPHALLNRRACPAIDSERCNSPALPPVRVKYAASLSRRAAPGLPRELSGRLECDHQGHG